MLPGRMIPDRRLVGQLRLDHVRQRHHRDREQPRWYGTPRLRLCGRLAGGHHREPGHESPSPATAV